MILIRRCIVLLVGCGLMAATARAQETKVSASSAKDVLAGYTPLFNGKDISGWYPYEDEDGSSAALFAVKNGEIHAYPKQEQGTEQPFGALITKESYRGDYDLRLEYRWGEKKYKPRDGYVRDAGVIFHVFEPDKMWPSGVECQIQEGDTGDMWLIAARASSPIEVSNRHYDSNGQLETRGDISSRYASFPRSFYWERPGWNIIDIEVRGDKATFKVNGHVVNEARDMKYYDQDSQSWKSLTGGQIVLQAEGAEVHYRNIGIRRFE